MEAHLGKPVTANQTNKQTYGHEPKHKAINGVPGSKTCACIFKGN